jgi:hypothetical protein
MPWNVPPGDADQACNCVGRNLPTSFRPSSTCCPTCNKGMAKGHVLVHGDMASKCMQSLLDGRRQHAGPLERMVACSPSVAEGMDETIDLISGRFCSNSNRVAYLSGSPQPSITWKPPMASVWAGTMRASPGSTVTRPSPSLRPLSSPPAA